LPALVSFTASLDTSPEPDPSVTPDDGGGCGGGHGGGGSTASITTAFASALASASSSEEAERTRIPLPDSSFVTIIEHSSLSFAAYVHTAYAPSDAAAGDASAKELSQRALLANTGLDAFSILRRMTPSYYTCSLSERRAELNAPSIHYSCKSLVMENTRWRPGATHASRYIMVIVPYTARLHNNRLAEAMYELQGGARKGYQFALCPPEVCEELTGYKSGSVTPLGSVQKLLVVLSHRVVQLKQPFFWVGGGEEFLSWRVSTEKFVEHFQPIIANVTYDYIKEDGPEI
jgi:prolyl-tRNA editing enzyme YbaK/EbsC (Cys-tRNA(Pro) deacylase)